MTALALVIGLIAIAASLSLIMSLAWAVEQRTGNSGWIDTVWTFGLGGTGVASALLPLPGETFIAPRQWPIAAMTFAWALRLGAHIARRSASRADDPRYAKLRNQWGDHASWQMWVLVQKQAVVTIPMALSVWLAAHNPAPGLRAQDLAGLLIVAIAIAGEALADSQLRAFTRNQANRGAVCDVGLWRWSRHPNYFFEWLAWLAYPVIAVELSGSYPAGWFALVAPACMYWLLVYVSGIPPLEDHMMETRGQAFRDYQARTNVFFPGPAR